MRLHAAAIAAVLTALAPPSRADSRFELDSPVNLFNERSFLVMTPNRITIRGDPQSPVHLLFEARIAPNLFLPQLQVGDIRDRPGAWMISAILTPMIELRALDEKSSPIAPPSFIPKLTLQLLHLRALARQGAAVASALALGLNLVVGHYSNGQTGCFYEGQSGSDPDCTPQPGTLPVNERSGSFSTNFLRAELHGLVGLDIDARARSAWVLEGGFGVEANSSLGPGGITGDQRPVYGDGHVLVHGGAERDWAGHRLRLSATASRPFGESPRQGATSTVELSMVPRWAGGFGALVRWLHGQDDYNILFLEHADLWQFGIVFELGPGFRPPQPSGPPGFTN